MGTHLAVPSMPLLRLLPLAAAAFALIVSDVAGQERVRPRTSLADSLSYRIATFAPSSGPPGTEVDVHWERLPAITPMRIGVGAQRVGFEVLKEVLSDSRGEFSETIRIPDWADTSRPVVLVVFDFYFNPLAISTGFQVTDSSGALSRTGRLQEPSGRCPELLTDEGQRYWLSGDLGTFRPGDRIVVQAKLADNATCGRGERDVVLEVTGVRRPIGS
jgi:hypothetical protein